MHEAQPAEKPSAAHALASPSTATALGVLVLALLGTTATLAALIHQATFLNIATGIPIPLVYATVGVIVARHQPRNPVGWQQLKWLACGGGSSAPWTGGSTGPATTPR